tara:strand:+ start:437 stop:637 length:201 start_codon:yes stop_codon:yes gene_type:complete
MVGMFNLFPSKKLHHFVLVQPPLREFSCMTTTYKAAFERLAYKFLPFLMLGKTIFNAWFISYLVQL